MAIKNLTYRNFIIVMNKIIAKGYDDKTAEDLTRKVFDNYYHDKGRGDRSVEWFIGQILTKEEYDIEQKMAIASAPSADQVETLTAEEQALVDEYMDRTDAIVTQEATGEWIVSVPEDTIIYHTKEELLDDIKYGIEQMNGAAPSAPSIESVKPEYTGGGIYIFTGKLSDGNYFMVDFIDGDDYWAIVVDEDPSDFDVSCYEEWQTDHLVKELFSVDRVAFVKSMLAWVKANKPDGNYSMKDMEYIEEDLDECMDKEAKGIAWR